MPASSITSDVGSASPRTDAVFVYGTLKRGQCRAHRWPASPLRVFEAWTRGYLLGRQDYPALTPGGQRVRGELWVFALDDVPRVLEVLDQIEGTHGNAPGDLYHRHRVTVFDLREGVQHHGHGYFYNLDAQANGFRPVPVLDGFQCWPD
jgi:gamma-glutamylcyclotransferase (GGCT)/AIG2-like uncharacterized protein YtfP